MSSRELLALSDIISVKHGYAFPGSGFSENDSFPTLLTPGNFQIGGGFREAQAKTFAGDIPQEYRLRSGDLIVTMTDLSKEGATLGLPALVPESGVYLHNQRVGLVGIKDPSRVTAAFLHYFLRGSHYRAHILGTASGSTVRHTSPSRIGAFIANLPKLDEQRAIAEVLGALDHKIAVNTILARSAVALASATFDRESKKARPVRLGDVATVVLGGTPSRARPGYWSNGTVPWMASGKANEDRILRPTSLITEEALAQSAAKMMPKGATVIAITGATLGQISRLEIEACGNQSLVGAWGETTWESAWLNFAIRSELLQLLRAATGAAQQHVNKADVKNLMIPWVDERALRAWGRLAGELLERARQADVESHSLIILRDELLPDLMSGRLCVKGAERIVEGKV